THLDLRAHVRANRPRLLTAALTCLRAYCHAGRPDMKLKPWGSFEGWSNLVRQCVVWLGQPDPGATREEVRKTADQEAVALATLLQTLQGRPMTATEILQGLSNPMLTPEQEATREAITTLCPTRNTDLPTQKSLGRVLTHLKGRVSGGLYLDSYVKHGL